MNISTITYSILAVIIGLVISTNVPVAYGEAYSPWPALFHDYSHSSLSQYNGPQSNATLWKYKTSHGLSAITIGNGGLIYFGGKDNLYVLNSTGILQWKSNFGGMVNSATIAKDGTIYFDNNARIFYALNHDGTKKWTFEAGGNVGSPAIGSDGTIYFGSDDHLLYALNQDGTKKWTFEAGGIIGPVTVSQGSDIYFGSSDNFFYDLDNTGKVKWKISTEDIPEQVALSHTGTIFYIDGKSLSAINSDGTVKWRFKQENTTLLYCAIDYSGTVYVGTFENYLYALSPDGKVKWEYKAESSIGPPVIGTNGTLYFNDGKGIIYSIGTVIPEFGSVAPIILVISILSTILLSFRTRFLSKI